MKENSWRRSQDLAWAKKARRKQHPFFSLFGQVMCKLLVPEVLQAGVSEQTTQRKNLSTNEVRALVRLWSHHHPG